MQKKNTLIIVGIMLIIGGLGFFIYYKMKTTPGNPSIATVFKSFLPFGSSTKTVDQNGNVIEGGSTNGNSTGLNEDGSPKILLKKITGFGVAGATSFMKGRQKVSGAEDSPTEDAPAIHYVERSNGHIHEMFTDTKEDLEITTSAIQSVYESVFDNTGNFVVYRYLDETGAKIESFLAKVGVPSGEYLPENILSITASPFDSSFFYISLNDMGHAVGTVFTPNGSKMTKIFDSSFTEWNTEWSTPNTVYLTTKPSWNTPGNLYSLSTNKGIYNKVLGGINGLTAKANQDGTHILYSEATSGGPELSVYLTNSLSSVDLNQNTFPEKCVFMLNTIDAICAIPHNLMSAKNPDAWYQGLESYNDSIYKINTNTYQSTLIYNTDNNGGLDATNLFLDKTENYLYFTNKKDSTLWSLELVK